MGFSGSCIELQCVFATAHQSVIHPLQGITQPGHCVRAQQDKPLAVKSGKGAAFAAFHAQLGPFQVTIARFYGVRAMDTGCFECMYPFYRIVVPEPIIIRSTRKKTLQP